ncbi:hypothetical protein BsWGS_18125 [Bradybaena similaris]
MGCWGSLSIKQQVWSTAPTLNVIRWYSLPLVSVLKALQRGKLPDLANELSKVAADRHTVLQWEPSHCGTPRNEKADRLAKKKSECEQIENEVTYFEKKRTIQTVRKEQPSPEDEYHTLDRKERFIIFRLRTGHYRLNKHMYRLHLIASPLCACGHDEQTAEHDLQVCPLYDHQRRTFWPSGLALHSKIYGTRMELLTKIGFIASTCLTL